MPTEEQLREIQEFWNSTAGQVVFGDLEAGLMLDWSTASDLARREELWHDMQALRRLQAALRDATSNKRLTQRAKVGQTYTA
jgi:hypothetical protein